MAIKKSRVLFTLSSRSSLRTKRKFRIDGAIHIDEIQPVPIEESAASSPLQSTVVDGDLLDNAVDASPPLATAPVAGKVEPVLELAAMAVQGGVVSPNVESLAKDPPAMLPSGAPANLGSLPKPGPNDHRDDDRVSPQNLLAGPTIMLIVWWIFTQIDKAQNAANTIPPAIGVLQPLLGHKTMTEKLIPVIQSSGIFFFGLGISITFYYLMKLFRVDMHMPDSVAGPKKPEGSQENKLNTSGPAAEKDEHKPKFSMPKLEAVALWAIMLGGISSSVLLPALGEFIVQIRRSFDWGVASKDYLDKAVKAANESENSARTSAKRAEGAASTAEKSAVSAELSASSVATNFGVLKAQLENLSDDVKNIKSTAPSNPINVTVKCEAGSFPCAGYSAMPPASSPAGVLPQAVTDLLERVVTSNVNLVNANTDLSKEALKRLQREDAALRPPSDVRGR